MLISVTVPFFPFASDSSAYIDTLYAVLDESKLAFPGVSNCIVLRSFSL
jgi:hypothetical protein